MRGVTAVLTLASGLAVAMPCAAQAASAPKYELLGEWGFHGDRYAFTSRGGIVSGRSLATVKIGKCRVRKGSLVVRQMTPEERERDRDRPSNRKRS